METLFIKNIRCRQCNRLLMKGRVQCIEIKCPKCGCIQVFSTPTYPKKSETTSPQNP